MPIDRLRFAGRFAPGGQVAPGATLFAEVRPPGLRETIEALAVDGAVEGQPRTWFGEVLKRGGLFDLLGAAVRTLPAVVRFVSRRAWEPLGLVNAEGEIVAVGTFGMAALPERELAVPAVHVRSIVPDAAERRVVAEVVSDGPAERPPVVAIMLVDTATGAPVAIDYNRLLQRERRADGALRVELRIPETTPLPPGRIRAHVMADLAVLAAVTF
ncbi:hypothetical protein L6Q96_20500 [Candidatus Binatia bacterium]|nr:hypothetical protein [Candidatus Binatia bacterium]